MIAQRLLVVAVAASLVLFSPQAYSAAAEPAAEKPAFSSLNELEWYVDELTDYTSPATSVKVIELDSLPAVCFDQAISYETTELVLAVPEQPYDMKKLRWRMSTLIGDIEPMANFYEGWDIGVNNGRLELAFIDHFYTHATLKYALAVQVQPLWPEDWLVSVVDRVGMMGGKIELLQLSYNSGIVFEASSGSPDFSCQTRYAYSLTRTPRTAEHWSVSPVSAKDAGYGLNPTSFMQYGYRPVILSKSPDGTNITMFWSNTSPPQKQDWPRLELDTGRKIGRFFTATALSDSYGVAFIDDDSRQLVFGLVHDAGNGLVVDTHEIPLNPSDSFDDPETAAMNPPYPNAVAMTAISDRPFICVTCSSWPGELKILWAKKTKPTSSNDWEQMVLDSDTPHGNTPSIAVIEGLPYIAYLASSAEGVVRIAMPVVKDK